MYGADPSGLTARITPARAAAIEEVERAGRQVALVVEEVEVIASRLALTTQVPWSGPAAHAWRQRVDASRRRAGGCSREVQELHQHLAWLAQWLEQ